MIVFLVGRELQTLHSLRRMFVKDLRERVRKAQVQIIPVVILHFQILGRKYRLRFGGRIDRAKTPNRLLRDKFKPTYHCAQAISAWQRRPQMWITETRKATSSNSWSCPKPWMWVFWVLYSFFTVDSILAALREAREGALKDRRKYQGEVEKIKVWLFLYYRFLKLFF